MAVRIALRTLLRSRWHAVATIGTIALTISLSSTVFAVVDGVLFKPLPYPEAGRLYFVDGRDGRQRTGRLSAIDIQYLADTDARLSGSSHHSGGRNSARSTFRFASSHNRSVGFSSSRPMAIQNE
jgi:hypothetical protein